MIEDPTAWSQFGLPGLIIGAGFWVMLRNAATNEKIITDMHREHKETIVTLMSEHKNERREWIEASKSHSIEFSICKKETNDVLRELAKAIEESNRRFRKDDS
jgi:hypothetical protein